MFKDTSAGRTHYQNDGCGEPAHNFTIEQLTEVAHKANEMQYNTMVLADFVAYCKEHPDYRFWQALSGWTGGKQIFLWKPPSPGVQITWPKMGLEDPFYWTDKDK